MTVYSRNNGTAAPTTRHVCVGGSAVPAIAVYQRIGGVPVLVSGAPPTNPFFVEGQSGRGFSATSSVPPLIGVQAGDVLLAFAAGNDQTATLTPPTGLTWTTIADTSTGTNSGVRIRLLAAVANGPLPEGTWRWNGTHNHNVTIGAWRNVKAPTTGARTLSGYNVTTVNAPTRTAVAAGALLICLGFHTSSADTSRAWSASMTTRHDAGVGSAGSLVADELLTAAGATGTRTYAIAPGGGVILAGFSTVLEPL